MEISGLLTDDLPTRTFGVTPTASPQYNNAYAPASPAHTLNDEPRTVVFYCPTHGRIPLRLELRSSLNSRDIDTMIRTFFAVGHNDEVSYVNGESQFNHVGYDECLAHSEFHVHVVQGPYYPPQSYPQSQNRHLHPPPNCHSLGAGVPGKGARSASPNSGRGRRSGSATGGRSRSMKRQNSSNAHSAVEQRVDDYMNDNGLQNSHMLQPGHYYQEESRTPKVEPVARAEISLENIVEGSRRKRAKFSSAELPLFPKPLHPASCSPSRPIPNNTTSTPHAQYAPNLQSLTPTSASPYNYNAQARGSQFNGRQYGQNYAPSFLTPAPTIATDISDEDAALQLMRLGEASTCSNSPSTLGETADDGHFSEDQAEDGRSDTTELPELPPNHDEREALADIQSSPSYSKITKKHKTLDEILPSFGTTEPSDNEEEHAKKDILHFNKRENHEDDFDYTEDAADETYKAEDREDEDDDYSEDECKGTKGSCSVATKKIVIPKPRLNKINTGRVTKQAAPAQPTRQPTILKVKPKPTTALYTAFNQAVKTNNIGKVPISPSSPTIFRNSSTASSIQSISQPKSRSTTASSSTLPTPISGYHTVPPPQPISQHGFLNGPPLGPIPHPHHHAHAHDEGEPEKPKPRCQRCRKSKKGCDRQRPCQRCKDAGIGIEGCISEDESNTRRGRAGIAKKAAGTNSAMGGAPINGVKKLNKPKKKKV